MSSPLNFFFFLILALYKVKGVINLSHFTAPDCRGVMLGELGSRVGGLKSVGGQNQLLEFSGITCSV